MLLGASSWSFGYCFLVVPLASIFSSEVCIVSEWLNSILIWTVASVVEDRLTSISRSSSLDSNENISPTIVGWLPASPSWIRRWNLVPVSSSYSRSSPPSGLGWHAVQLSLTPKGEISSVGSCCREYSVQQDAYCVGPLPPWGGHALRVVERHRGGSDVMFVVVVHQSVVCFHVLVWLVKWNVHHVVHGACFFV